MTGLFVYAFVLTLFWLFFAGAARLNEGNHGN